MATTIHLICIIALFNLVKVFIPISFDDNVSICMQAL